MSDVPPATPRNFKIHYHMQLSINLIVIVRMKIWMCVCCASKSSLPLKSSAPCKATCCLQCAFASALPSPTIYLAAAVITSIMSASAKRLSVIRVITISVKVDLVMVSLIVPSSVGAAGNMGMSGSPFRTFTVTVEPASVIFSFTSRSAARPPLRKCAGIIA